jgi:hypothetical protein
VLSGYNILCNRHDCGTQMANVKFILDWKQCNIHWNSDLGVYLWG